MGERSRSFWARRANPLEPVPAAPYVRAVEDQDVEVFERIPWEALEKQPDRRWMAYATAMAIVLGAVGITIGRGMATPQPEPPPEAMPPVVTTAPARPVDAPAAPPEDPGAIGESPAWSQADLMALPEASLETTAAVVAEWFVVDHFTREEDGRSFVDWAGVAELTWTGTTTIDATVIIRRLAALEDDPYQRLPAEAWQVTTELIDGSWAVTHGPVPVDPPALEASLPSYDLDVPAEVAALVPGSTTGAHEVGDRWSVEWQWTDDAGLTWTVTDWVEPPP